MNSGGVLHMTSLNFVTMRREVCNIEESGVHL